MERTVPRSGWISYTDGPGGMDHLPPDARAEVERREAVRSRVSLAG
jgi:hypothetical protein